MLPSLSQLPVGTLRAWSFWVPTIRSGCVNSSCGQIFARVGTLRTAVGSLVFDFTLGVKLGSTLG